MDIDTCITYSDEVWQRSVTEEPISTTERERERFEQGIDNVRLWMCTLFSLYWLHGKLSDKDKTL